MNEWMNESLMAILTSTETSELESMKWPPPPLLEISDLELDFQAIRLPLYHKTRFVV